MTADLMKLTELCVAFKDATEARIESNRKLQKKAIAALKPGEMEELQSLAMELAADGLGIALGGKVSDDFLRLNIKAVEKVAELALRIMPEDTLRADVPADLKNDEAIKALTAHGAANLARLASPK